MEFRSGDSRKPSCLPNRVRNFDDELHGWLSESFQAARQEACASGSRPNMGKAAPGSKKNQ
jgi:hypothetical protein